MWITLLKQICKSGCSKLQMRLPRSRINPIKTLINKMPASGAREKSTGRTERRITDLGLAYTSTSCKVKKMSLFIAWQPSGCECHSALAFTFITVVWFTAPPQHRGRSQLHVWGNMDALSRSQMLPLPSHTRCIQRDFLAWNKGLRDGLWPTLWHDCQKNIMLYRNFCSHRLSCNRECRC